MSYFVGLYCLPALLFKNMVSTVEGHEQEHTMLMID